MRFKRITAIAVYDKQWDDLEVVQIPNNGKHWKELCIMHPEFEDDDLYWVSDDFATAQKQFYKNNLIVEIKHYDIINPMTKQPKVQNED